MSKDDVGKELEAFVAQDESSEVQSDDGEKSTPILRQIIAVSGPLMITLCSGLVSGYSAILLPQLNEPSSSIQVTKNQESWIASLAPLPTAVGCIFGGWGMERYGRKRAQIATILVFLIGWCAIYFSTSVEHIMVGRFITGICVGTTGPAIASYIGEVSHPKLRGIFLAGISLGVATGLFISHLIGIFLTWKNTALASMVFPLIALIPLIISPESHIWYSNKGDVINAKRAFFWFRGSTKHAQVELQKILDDKKGPQKTFREIWKDCKTYQFIKPLLILNLFFVTTQGAGNNAVVFYSVSIMQQTVQTLDKYTAMIIIDIIRIIMSIIACVLTKKFCVRPLTIISGFGTVCSLYTLSIFVLLIEAYPTNIIFPYIPLVALISYIVFITIGLVPIPWSLCGEILPPSTKGVGGGVSTCVNFLAFFLVVKTSPEMFETLGTAGTFTSYGTVALVGTVILCWVLPETKNKTLKEIEACFAPKRRENCIKLVK